MTYESIMDYAEQSGLINGAYLHNPYKNYEYHEWEIISLN